MPRPTTKNDLLIAAADNYKKLNELISNLTKKELDTPFDFSKDEKKERSTLEKRHKFKRYFSSSLWVASVNFKLGTLKSKWKRKIIFA